MPRPHPSGVASLPQNPTLDEQHAARGARGDPSSKESLVRPLRSTADGRVGSQAASARGAGSEGAEGRRNTSGGKAAAADGPTSRRRFSALEAYEASTEVVDGQQANSFISKKVHRQPQQHRKQSNIARRHPSSSATSTSSSNDEGGNNHQHTPVSSQGGSSGPKDDSTLTVPGARNSFFFGADYAGKVKPKHKQHEMAKTMGKPDDGVGAASHSGSTGGNNVGRNARRNLVGGARNGGGRKEVLDYDGGLALQDVENSDVGSGAGSASPRGGAEAPPGLAPLGEDEEADLPGLIGGVASRGSTGQVAFPLDFDAGRKGSDSDDSANSSKTRGGGSLGTKSGSTSLLSILSASPRSLSTAQNSAGGSPRTPLSDHSLETRRDSAGSSGGVRGAAARRTNSAQVGADLDGQNCVGSVAEDGRRSVPVSATAVVAAASETAKNRFGVPDVITAVDDHSVSSSNPTPLYSIEHDDEDLPSEHPTPLSTAGNLDRRKTFSREQRSQPSSATAKTRHSPAQPRVRGVESSSFKDRLKYWSGGGATDSKSSPRSSVGSGRNSVSTKKPATTDREHLQPETSPAERRGLPVAPIHDSSEEPSPADFVSAGTGWRERSSGGATLSVPQTDDEVKPIPSPSPGRHFDGAQPHSRSGLPARGDRVFFDATSDSVLKGGQLPQPATSKPSSGGDGGEGRGGLIVDVTVPSSSKVDQAPTSAGSSARRSPFVETVDHEDKLIDEMFPVDDDEGEEYSDEAESEMDWEANSTDEQKVEEKETEKSIRLAGATAALRGGDMKRSSSVAQLRDEPQLPIPPPPQEQAQRPPANESVAPYSSITTGRVVAAPPARPSPATSGRSLPPPPRYMAIVDAASGHSALNSSTSEHDTSPSEDDGDMMAEILTDRLMEVASKMDAAVPAAADDISDGEGQPGRRNSVGGKIAAAVLRRRMSNRSFSRDMGGGGALSRRPSRPISFRSTTSLCAAEQEGKDFDSDEGSVIEEGAAARKLRRERVRRRASSRRVTAALNVPVDAAGVAINPHTAAYNGHRELLEAYLTQGGDLEVRDQFQATPLILCAERGHVDMVDSLLAAGADPGSVDENGNSALHLACFYGNSEVVQLLLMMDCDVGMQDNEGRTPLQLSTDPHIQRLIHAEEMVRMSGDRFDLLEAVEVNDTDALASFIQMGQEACGHPNNSNAVPLACRRLRLDRQGRGGMSAVHLAAFHGYADALELLLDAGADPNAVCDEGETPLHTACTGGSTVCATLLLNYGGNPLATDAKGLVPCEKHIAGGRQEMKRLLEKKAFQATPANLLVLRNDLAEVALQIDAEEDLFVRKGVAIKYLRKALKKKDQDLTRLRTVVDTRDVDIRNLRDRMDSVHRLISGLTPL